MHCRHAAHALFTDGDKIKVALVVFVDKIVCAWIIITGNLQNECPVEQAVNIGKLLWRFGSLKQVESLVGLVRWRLVRIVPLSDHPPKCDGLRGYQGEIGDEARRM